MANYETLVLAGILPDNLNHLIDALQNLTEDHFVDSTNKIFWQLIDRYYTTASGVLPLEFLSDLLDRKKVDPGKVIYLEEAFATLTKQEVAEHEFLFALDALKQSRKRQLTGEAIATGFEILERGAYIEKQDLKGADDAMEYIEGALNKIRRIDLVSEAPQGFMADDWQRLKKIYEERKQAGESAKGVLSGIGVIDFVTDGFQKGELVLFAGWAGSGKSQTVTQTAWNAAYVQGKNVAFFTSETTRDQVERRLAARHSKLPQFGCDGLDSAKIKNASLSPAEEEVYFNVLEDMHSNPEYGNMFVSQVPPRATMKYLETELRRQQDQWNIDLVVIDYIALYKAMKSRSERWSELTEILQDAKDLAVSHNDGAGVPILSPWQTPKKAYEYMLSHGEYTLMAMAETTEAERSADQIWAIVKFPDEHTEMKFQCLKVRDGAMPSPFVVATDFKSSYLGELIGPSMVFNDNSSDLDFMNA